MYLSLRDDKLALKECEKLAKYHIPALACPLFQLVKQDIDLSAYDKIDAFILTSQKAAHALPGHLTDVPVYVVGRASAAIMRQKGFHNIIAGPDDGKALAQIIKDDFANKRVGISHKIKLGDDIKIGPVIALKSSWFNNFYNPKLNQTLMHFGACKSYYNQSLSDALLGNESAFLGAV